MPLLYTKPLHQQPPGHAATPLCGASQNSQNGGFGKQAMRAPCETHTGGQKEAGNCSGGPARRRPAQRSFLHQLPTAGNKRIKMLVCRKASADPPTSPLFARYPTCTSTKRHRSRRLFGCSAARLLGCSAARLLSCSAAQLFRMPFPTPFSQRLRSQPIPAVWLPQSSQTSCSDLRSLFERRAFGSE